MRNIVSSLAVSSAPRSAFGAQQRASHEIDANTVELEYCTLRVRLRRLPVRDHVAQAQEQFFEFNRLGDIVIGAERKRANAIF